VSRASDIEGLEKDCFSAYTERVTDIRRNKRETKSFINKSTKEREAMAADLHKKIGADEAARKKQAKADQESREADEESREADVQKLKADTQKTVKQMNADTEAMAADLHKKIGADEAARKKQAKADQESREADGGCPEAQGRYPEGSETIQGGNKGRKRCMEEPGEDHG